MGRAGGGEGAESSCTVYTRESFWPPLDETQEAGCGPGTQLRESSLRGSMSGSWMPGKQTTKPVEVENGGVGRKELGLGPLSSRVSSFQRSSHRYLTNWSPTSGTPVTILQLDYSGQLLPHPGPEQGSPSLALTCPLGSQVSGLSSSWPILEFCCP